jgi:hypothetical protein
VDGLSTAAACAGGVVASGALALAAGSVATGEPATLCVATLARVRFAGAASRHHSRARMDGEQEERIGNVYAGVWKSFPRLINRLLANQVMVVAWSMRV